MPAAIANRRFNAAEYKDDFRDLIATNPELAADSATKVARKKRNAENDVNDAESATQAMVATLGTLVIMGAAGAWQGGMKAKRDALIADWEVEGSDSVGAVLSESPEPWDHTRGVKDPCCWWVIPKLLIFPVLLGGVAAIAASMRKKTKRIGTFERTATMAAGATFGLVVADMVGGMTYKSKEKKLAASDDVKSVKELAQAS